MWAVQSRIRKSVYKSYILRKGLNMNVLFIQSGMKNMVEGVGHEIFMELSH